MDGAKVGSVCDLRYLCKRRMNKSLERGSDSFGGSCGVTNFTHEVLWGLCWNGALGQTLGQTQCMDEMLENKADSQDCATVGDAWKLG